MKDMHEIKWKAKEKKRVDNRCSAQMKKMERKQKSASCLHEGGYCLQMAPLPMYQHNMSAFVQEQSSFMAKVQPTVPL